LGTGPTGPSLVGGTMALCQGPRASKRPRAPAANCCKRRYHAPCIMLQFKLHEIWSIGSQKNH